MPTQEGRITKLKARRSQTSAQRVPSQKSQVPLVERTNALSIEDFISFYVSPHQDASSNQSTKTPRANETESVQPKRPLQSNAARDTSLEIYSAATISTADLDACLDLVELTSSEAYAASGAGWSRPKKRKEMKLPDMKYLIVRDCAASSADIRREAGVGAGTDKADEPKIAARSSENVNGSLNGSANEHANDKSGVLGFLSFMITYEDGKEVVYCYEIHLAAAARGRGLGALLMSRMEEIGRSVGVKKAMLTVFKSNVNACRFYEKGGYVIDEYSPQPRRLRNGTIKEFDYAILSKRLE
ncbi:uncharacterized protein N7484_011576 [Penicillium longicatenatum]|uniref:uncharacterized protein n=1 Tax=Penicillium longicatenatum TaxID=1561947 RepID=UPI002547E086|nr:uncharacterized protein N7484_011576 [Penicillium longicatenatum]KAJ5631476.1 hypothetical protein N7484_011576 [Penicillium longicatenatum]